VVWSFNKKLPENTLYAGMGKKNTKIKEKKSFLIQASLGPSSDFGAPISSRFKKLSSSRKIGVDWAILRFHKPGKPGRYHIYGACFM